MNTLWITCWLFLALSTAYKALVSQVIHRAYRGVPFMGQAFAGTFNISTGSVTTNTAFFL